MCSDGGGFADKGLMKDTDETAQPFLPDDDESLAWADGVETRATSPGQGPGPGQSPEPGQAGGMSRRRFLKCTGLAIGAAAVGGAVDALAIEPHWFKVTRHDIVVPNLPPKWDGATIAQISDIHIGPHSTLAHAREIVDMCNDLKPDIIALTGDYVSKADAITQALVEVLRDLRAGVGKFAVLGNHDYWADARGVIASLRSAGIPLLKNSHRIAWRAGQPLCFAGVDDLFTGRADAARALAGVGREAARVLLCHNPDYAEQLPAEPRVDLMLAGHTHGGQVVLPLIGPPVLPIKHRKYAAGLVSGPRCKVFVSRGLGMVGVPIRFNCRPELPLITMKSYQ